PAGSTRTYHPVQYFPELTNQAARKRFDGLIGSWMPAVRKVVTVSETAYDEIVVFGDVQARDKFIVQTWHRTARVENGKITRVVYGHTYPGFPPRREDPSPEQFYRALVAFTGYWEMLLSDFVDATGVNNMRGPEIAQFGLTLSLLARYFNYTGDDALLLRHRDKIAATAALLVDLHEESLRLPQDDPGYGLIHGWSESDSCLAPKPMTWWLPY